MIFLILNIVFSSCFILCVKWVQMQKKMDVVSVGCVNYIAAALFALPRFLDSEPSDRIGYAIGTGIAMGICYFVAFFFLIYAVKWVGASNSAAVSRISLVVPIGMGIWFWGESPDAFQVCGILLALASLMLIGRVPKRYRRKQASETQRVGSSPEAEAGLAIHGFRNHRQYQLMVVIVLGIFFLICGASRLTQQACQRLSGGLADYPAFLQSAFVAAGLPSIVVLLWRQIRLKPVEVVVGVLLGLTNILQSHFILRSLDVFDGFLVFTLTSTGGLVVTTAVAVFGFREKMTRPSLIGLTLATVSILLLQLPVGTWLSNPK